MIFGQAASTAKDGLEKSSFRSILRAEAGGHSRTRCDNEQS